MKITVTASRLDDIRKERDAYNAEAKKQNAIHDQQEQKYRFAEDFNDASVENAIRSQVPGLDGVDIRADMYYGAGYRVEFSAENRDNALRWRWTVALDRQGNLMKESSSWSGVEVTTPEDVANLQKTVNILSALVNLDWEPILRAGAENYPKYEDYISVREMKDKAYEFQKDLRAAFIDDIIGKDIWIKGNALADDRWSRGRQNWYMIKSQTDKFYTICTLSDWNVSQYLRNAKNNATREGDNGEQIPVDWIAELKDTIQKKTQWTDRVKKEKFIPCLSNPIETMDMEGNIQTYNQDLEPVDPNAQEDAEASTSISSNLITL